MSEAEWSRQNLQRLDRIRQRFNSYFAQKRNSASSNNSDTSVEDKIQNEWRKIHDLIYKEIPKRVSSHPNQLKHLDFLKKQAHKLHQQFKHRFGSEKHEQFKLKENTNQWQKSVMKSYFRSKSHPSQSLEEPNLEEIVEQNEQTEGKPSTVSQIFKKQYLSADNASIQRLKQVERRSNEEQRQARLKKSKQNKMTFCFILSLVLLLVAVGLILYFRVPIQTGLIKAMMEL